MNRSIRSCSRPVPGIQWGDYPELDEPDDAASPRTPANGGLLPIGPATLQSQVAAVRAHLAAWAELSVNEFLMQQRNVQERLVRDGLDRAALQLACAFAARAASIALGKTAYDCQLAAALGMLDNRLVEMATGEGKSLAAALAATVGALAGIPVHVLTSNDYLVARDAEQFAPLYHLLGFGVAAVTATQVPELRRAAYAQPIVYVTAQELVFDYLRDRLQHGAGQPALQRRALTLAAAVAAAQVERPMLRGLCMAIVDEADSILIDEAQMPLVLSRAADGVAQRALLWQAYALSGQLVEHEDFQHQHAERRVQLTAAGRARIERLATRLQPVWKNHQHREETIASALTARHVFVRDRDYAVTDGEVQIIDAVTGRIAVGRKWSRGLHALVSIKEGCQAEPELETLAQITFQRFFRRYVRFGGMSGTLREARAELSRIYGVGVVKVAPRRPSRRLQQPTRVFADDAARWAAAVQRIGELQRSGRPVLVGCDSVADSQTLAARLNAAGIAHKVLNANFDRSEAEIINLAGRAGQVTVSTNMAGRGTDIHVDASALAAGGLHVLCCQHNASRRHDRQLAGRAGRQGEPGSAEAWISLQSVRFTADVMARAQAHVCRAFVRDGEVRAPGWLLNLVLSTGQRREETRQTRRRLALFQQDGDLERGLSFCGLRE